MSISKFREFIEKPGCAWTFGIVMIFVMGFGMVMQSGQGDSNNGPGRANPTGGKSVATVGEYPVTEDSIWAMANQTLSMFAQQLGGAVPPRLVATYVGSATEQQINAGLLLELAHRSGVSLDDAAIMKATDKAIDEEIERRKQELISQKKLSATSSPAVFDNAHKVAYQDQTPKQFKEALLKQYTEALKNPAQKNQIIVGSANTLVMDKYMSEIPATEEAVKAFYDLYLCKRVFLKTSLHPGEDLIKKAEAIKKEIDGGLNFLAAMDKYTDDPPGPKKTKRDNEFQVDGKTAGLNESYTPLTKLKPGEVGGPYTFGDEGVSIVQFNAKTTQLPPDFETKKTQLIKDYQRDNAARKLQDGLKKLKGENLIKWQSPAYHALYDLVSFDSDEESRKLDPAARTAKYEEIMKRSQEAMSDPLGSRSAPLVLYLAFEKIWEQAGPAERAKLTTKRTEVLREVLQQSESTELRLELAELLSVEKDATGTAESLRLAASSIASDFGPNGQRYYSDIQGKLLKFKASKLLSSEQETEIRAILAQWMKDKVESEKFAAEQKKAEAEAAAKAAAEEKKAKADAAKKKGGK